MLDVFDNLSDKSAKVTYSSSFGKTQFTNEEWEHEKKSLHRFNILSCREESGIEIMKKMGLNNPQCIIDPVFLLSRRKWEKLASNKYKEKKYILVYNLHHDKNIESFKKKMSHELNLPVINVCNHWFQFYRYGKCKWVPNIEDFLSLLYNAEYVITDSFHATAFSIIFNLKFISVVPELVGTRIVNILSLFDMKERMIGYGQKIEDASVLYKELDSYKIDKIIDNEIKKAIKYIDTWNALTYEDLI